MAELTGKIEWKVNAGQHNGHENVPPTEASNKCKSTRSFLTLESGSSIALGCVEVGAGKETESWDKGEEDKEEDQVGADGADKIDKA
jgi:hypothetical protein